MSVAAIRVLVSVKLTVVLAAREAAFIVICPQVLLKVTAVALLVSCVTAPPAPVAYPTPPVPLDRIEVVAATVVPA